LENSNLFRISAATADSHFDFSQLVIDRFQSILHDLSLPMQTPCLTDIFCDLGGVLFLVDHQPALKKIAEASPLNPNEIQQRLWNDGSVIRYQIGEIDTATFLAGQCDLFQFRGSAETLGKIWSHIFQPCWKNLEILEHLSNTHRIHALSNTCPLHITALTQLHPIFTRFQTVTYSFQIGFMKPRTEIFLAALAQAKTEAAHSLFIDDTPQHLAAADTLAFQTLHCPPGETLATLIPSILPTLTI
jgi:glucose-1-phosphatase